MKDLFCQMDFWALVIAVITMLGSVVGFFLHDHKLKQQEKKINEFTIAQLRESQEAKRKAQVSAYVDIGKYGHGKIFVKNRGQSVARNIRITGFDSTKLIILDDSILPFEYLNPDEEFPIIVALLECSDHKLDILIEWDDDFENDRHKNQILVID